MMKKSTDDQLDTQDGTHPFGIAGAKERAYDAQSCLSADISDSQKRDQPELLQGTPPQCSANAMTTKPPAMVLEDRKSNALFTKKPDVEYNVQACYKQAFTLCISLLGVGLSSNLAGVIVIIVFENGDLYWDRNGFFVFSLIFIATWLAIAVFAKAVIVRAFQIYQNRGVSPRRKRLHGCTVLCSGFFTGIVFFFCAVLLARRTGSKDLDDFNVAYECDYLNSFAQKPHARFLWVIPVNYSMSGAHHQNVTMGIPISHYPEWCTRMLSLEEQGFILGMHGVLHSPHEDGRREFEGLIDARERLDYGVKVWREAFGKAPTHFAFPGFFGEAGTVKLLRDEYKMTVRTNIYSLLHPIYHCNVSTWCASSFCQNWFQDFIAPAVVSVFAFYLLCSLVAMYACFVQEYFSKSEPFDLV